MEWSIDERGTDEVVVRIQAIKGFRDEIKNLVDQAAFNAGAYMKTHVPFHKGTLYRAIFVSANGAQYKPGGAGGGGTYEARVGVNTQMAPHAPLVLGGTGLWDKENPKNGIFPRTKKVMVFPGGGNLGGDLEDAGSWVFTKYTRGQHPNSEWYDDAVELAARTIQAGIFGLDIDVPG